MAGYESTVTTITVRSQPRYAGLGSRVLAFLIDGVVIGAAATVATLGRPLAGASQGLTEMFNWPSFVETLIGFGYFTILWSSIGGGQTAGMRLLGIRVVDTEMQPIGYLAAVVRWIGIVVSAALMLVGLIWAAFDPHRQGWHDKLAGSFVVRSVDDRSAAGEQSVEASTATLDRPHPVARGFAVMAGVFGALLGLLGLELGLAGDAMIPVGVELWAAGFLAGLALISAVFAWWHPGYGALAMIAVTVGYALVLGGYVGPWWDGYNTAIANPVSEQQYWNDAPAIASFVVSGIFVIGAAVLSLVANEWGGPARVSEAHGR